MFAPVFFFAFGTLYLRDGIGLVPPAALVLLDSAARAGWRRAVTRRPGPPRVQTSREEKG